MKLSRKTEYALRALVDFAMDTDREVVQIPDLARREHLPAMFLEQILLAI
ncbi:MAG: Rrf2 family transcriptional regulator [Candidatus Latescibacterota bacterium]